MMFPALLALALLLPAGEAGATAASPGAAAPASTAAALDDRITLKLEKADLSQVLERLATLLGKTLILQPGTEGLVNLDAKEVPISDVIAGLQTSHGISVRLEGDRMFVTKAGEKPRLGPGKPDDEALSRAFFADSSLPRRAAAEKPKRFGGSFEFRAEGDGGAPAVWEIGQALGTVTLPGCAGPMPVLLFDGDFFDGIPRIVIMGNRRGGPALARIAAPEGTVRLPDCIAPLTVKARDSKEGASKAVPLSQPGAYLLNGQLLEVRADGDEVLSAPRVVLPAGEAGTMESGSQFPGASGALLNQGIRMNVAILSAGDNDALVACSVSVTRDVEPEPGQPPVTIRVARADESLRLAYGKPERVTVSPTYGRGQSALVLELTLEKLPEKR
jgi:hypothetical protein